MHDGRAVLVVVHHGYVALLFETLLYLEAFRCLDVLKIDASEGGGDSFDDVDETLRILFVDLYVEAVDAGEDLEE